jgi:hypothetical protein
MDIHIIADIRIMDITDIIHTMTDIIRAGICATIITVAIRTTPIRSIVGPGATAVLRTVTARPITARRRTCRMATADRSAA